MEEGYQGTTGAESGYQAGNQGGYQQGYQSNNGYQQQGMQGNPDWDFLNSNFKSLVPPQYQQMVSKYNNFVDFLDSFNAAQGLIGKKVSDFANSDWQTYANMVQQTTGIPADPSGYQLQRQEGSILDETDDALCRELSCNLGLSNDQANGLQMAMENFGQAVREADYQQQMAVQQELEARWGNNYAYKEQAIHNAFTDVIPQLFGENTDAFGADLQAAMARHPTVARLVAAVGELAMNTPTGGYGNTTTPQGAAATIDQLRNDPEFMNKYINQSHPRHAQAKDTMQKLLKLKNGEL